MIQFPREKNNIEGLETYEVNRNHESMIP